MMIGATPQRLHLMQLGSGDVPTAAQPLEMPLGCYLIQTGDGKNILIDRWKP